MDSARYVRKLWGDDVGQYMFASQTAELSESVSSQRTGIVLHWQAYSSGHAQNYDHNFFFVPKTHVERNNGGGVAMFLAISTGSTVATKYVYVHDGKVVGNDINSRDPYQGSGITLTPKYFVLTEVLGV